MIDLRHGRAVHGQSGHREQYRPVVSQLYGSGPADLSDPVRLLLAYRERLGSRLVYLADLDRVDGSGDNDSTVPDLLGAAPETCFLWDAGLTVADRPPPMTTEGRLLPILATETLASLDELGRMVDLHGVEPVLGLDLSEAGVVARSGSISSIGETGILRRAASEGVTRTVVVLLGRVGTRAGVPEERLRRLKEAGSGMELYIGGGVSSLEDVSLLERLGYSGVLLATALHDGSIDPKEIGAAGFLD